MRKKSASKRAPKKSVTSGSAEDPEKELPLEETSTSVATTDTNDAGDQKDEKKPARKGREPKSGVRDARRETAEDPIPAEVTEKLVPDIDESNKSKDSNDSRQKGGQRKQTRNDDSSSGSKDQGQGRNDVGERRGRGRGRGGRERGERREPKPRVTVDSKDLTKKAWEIFESEVTEEGLALLDDNGLRDYAKSSFNAARLFLEEKERVTSREKQAKAEQKKREKENKEEHENSEKDD